MVCCFQRQDARIEPCVPRSDAGCDGTGVVPVTRPGKEPRHKVRGLSGLADAAAPHQIHDRQQDTCPNK